MSHERHIGDVLIMTSKNSSFDDAFVLIHAAQIINHKEKNR